MVPFVLALLVLGALAQAVLRFAVVLVAAVAVAVVLLVSAPQLASRSCLVVFRACRSVLRPTMRHPVCACEGKFFENFF
jgi:hypothetical protein